MSFVNPDELPLHRGDTAALRGLRPVPSRPPTTKDTEVEDTEVTEDADGLSLARVRPKSISGRGASALSPELQRLVRQHGVSLQRRLGSFDATATVRLELQDLFDLLAEQTDFEEALVACLTADPECAARERVLELVTRHRQQREALLGALRERSLDGGSSGPSPVAARLLARELACEERGLLACAATRAPGRSTLV